ncbi:MAG: hypothetical protein NUV81_02730 [bacterium]|nr:hypothetical protein [bacterium]
MRKIVTLIVIILAAMAVNHSEKITTMSVFEKRPPASNGSVCEAEPVETESGQLVYPVSPLYSALPHLGQVFTALDCEHNNQLNSITGMTKDQYMLGVTLLWREDHTPDDVALILQVLGFQETKSGKWSHPNPLSLDDLMELRNLLRDPAIRNALEQEDCILCG